MGSAPPKDSTQKLLIVISESVVSLSSIYSELRDKRLRREATWVAQATIFLQQEDDPVESVRHAVSLLRTVDSKLIDFNHEKLAQRVRGIRHRLSFYADALLEDTKRLSTGEYQAQDDDP